MNDLNHNDLALISAALRGFIHSTGESIDHYVDSDNATMLLCSMKEEKYARELLRRVLDAENRCYEEHLGEI